MRCSDLRRTRRKWRSAMAAPSDSYVLLPTGGGAGFSGVGPGHPGPRPSLADRYLRAPQPFHIPANPATPAASMSQARTLRLSAPLRALRALRARVWGRPGETAGAATRPEKPAAPARNARAWRK